MHFMFTFGIQTFRWRGTPIHKPSRKSHSEKRCYCPTLAMLPAAMWGPWTNRNNCNDTSWHQVKCSPATDTMTKFQSGPGAWSYRNPNRLEITVSRAADTDIAKPLMMLQERQTTSESKMLWQCCDPAIQDSPIGPCCEENLSRVKQGQQDQNGCENLWDQFFSKFKSQALNQESVGGWLWWHICQLSEWHKVQNISRSRGASPTWKKGTSPSLFGNSAQLRQTAPISWQTGLRSSSHPSSRSPQLLTANFQQKVRQKNTLIRRPPAYLTSSLHLVYHPENPLNSSCVPKSIPITPSERTLIGDVSSNNLNKHIPVKQPTAAARCCLPKKWVYMISTVRPIKVMKPNQKLVNFGTDNCSRKAEASGFSASSDEEVNSLTNIDITS